MEIGPSQEQLLRQAATALSSLGSQNDSSVARKLAHDLEQFLATAKVVDIHGQRLKLRAIEIPRGPIVEMMEAELDRPLTHEHRHHLAEKPVTCGDLLELFHEGEWVLGRYEWTTNLDELPTWEAGELVLWLDGSQLLRWPK